MEREGKKEIFFPHTQQDTESWVSEVSGSTPGSHFPSWQIFLLESPRARVESKKKILQIMTPRGYEAPGSQFKIKITEVKS